MLKLGECILKDHGTDSAMEVGTLTVLRQVSQCSYMLIASLFNQLLHSKFPIPNFRIRIQRSNYASLEKGNVRLLEKFWYIIA